MRFFTFPKKRSDLYFLSKRVKLDSVKWFSITTENNHYLYSKEFEGDIEFHKFKRKDLTFLSIGGITEKVMKVSNGYGNSFFSSFNYEIDASFEKIEEITSKDVYEFVGSPLVNDFYFQMSPFKNSGEVIVSSGYYLLREDYVSNVEINLKKKSIISTTEPKTIASTESKKYKIIVKKSIEKNSISDYSLLSKLEFMSIFSSENQIEKNNLFSDGEFFVMKSHYNPLYVSNGIHSKEGFSWSNLSSKIKSSKNNIFVYMENQILELPSSKIEIKNNINITPVIYQNSSIDLNMKILMKGSKSKTYPVKDTDKNTSKKTEPKQAKENSKKIQNVNTDLDKVFQMIKKTMEKRHSHESWENLYNYCKESKNLEMKNIINISQAKSLYLFLSSKNSLETNNESNSLIGKWNMSIYEYSINKDYLALVRAREEINQRLNHENISFSEIYGFSYHRDFETRDVSFVHEKNDGFFNREEISSYLYLVSKFLERAFLKINSPSKDVSFKTSDFSSFFNPQLINEYEKYINNLHNISILISSGGKKEDFKIIHVSDPLMKNLSLRTKSFFFSSKKEFNFDTFPSIKASEIITEVRESLITLKKATEKILSLSNHEDLIKFISILSTDAIKSGNEKIIEDRFEVFMNLIELKSLTSLQSNQSKVLCNLLIMSFILKKEKHINDLMQIIHHVYSKNSPSRKMDTLAFMMKSIFEWSIRNSSFDKIVDFSNKILDYCFLISEITSKTTKFSCLVMVEILRFYYLMNYSSDYENLILRIKKYLALKEYLSKDEIGDMFYHLIELYNLSKDDKIIEIIKDFIKEDKDKDHKIEDKAFNISLLELLYSTKLKSNNENESKKFVLEDVRMIRSLTSIQFKKITSV